MAHATDGWGLRDVRQRCQDLREVLADSSDLCSPEELAAYWPGGVENKIAGRGGWYYCLTQYGRMLGRLERVEGADQEVAEQAALDASQELPLSVTLQDPDAESQPRTFSVYPKSYEVIAFGDELDVAIRWLLARAEALIQADDPVSVLAGQDALHRVTTIHQLMCWIACSPGCGAPYPIEQPPPQVPEPYHSLSPLDVVRILAAYVGVNRTRVALSVSLLRSTGEESKRVQWSVLAAGAAKNMNQPIEQLLKHRSFGAWVAQFVLVSRAEIEQAERANAERKRAPEMAEML